MTDPGRPGRTGRAIALTALLVLLAGSVATYAFLLPLQRSVFMAGVPAADPQRLPRPADLAEVAAAQARYLPLVAAALLAYVLVLVLVRWVRGPVLGRVAVATGVIGHLALLLAKPGLSIDLYSYIAHGYLASQPGSNPYLMAAAGVAGTPELGPALVANGWIAVHPETPYGPVWTQLERLAFQFSGGDVTLAALLLKAVVVVATIGTALVAWRVAERVRAGAGPLAATAWLLNPLVVVEFGVEGHNDAVAIFFTVLALLAALRGWALVAVLALAAGTLVKYLPAAFAFPVLVLLLRGTGNKVRIWVELVLGVALAGVATWWLWSPWWAGLDTFAGLRASATPSTSLSPAGLLGPMAFDPTTGEANLLPLLILGGALLAVSIAASWGRRPSSWLAGCGIVAVATLAISPVYWPWYSALAIGVLVLRPTIVSLLQVVVLTAGSRYVALWGDLAAVGSMSFEEVFTMSPVYGITYPIAACLALALVGAAVHGIRYGMARRRETA